ncbi:hypothetical protein EST38_g561 [Candolleomyces aberdarensis]|uniref:Uncharacterized protein n=1 Tax=Candolleomyces aberdarensis TaxID=2316362 RepID=A0A4Q2DZP6_9AGAR|nr:hypothetical protein EST38_g561 [Candolleomyces aberdarensis]
MSSDSKPIHIHTLATPNGVAASAYLEELKKQYLAFDYEHVHAILGK